MKQRFSVRRWFPGSVRTRRTRLMIEMMEDRRLLSTFLVTDTNDDTNPGSLRWAIGQANAAAGSTIDFQIATSGVQTIALTAAIPPLNVPVTIDGTSEPGYAGTPLIELDGAAAGTNVDGLDIAGGNSVVSGLAINRFSGAGIKVLDAGNNTIQDDDIGTDPTGNLGEGNGGDGILVTTNSNTNTILDNVISANKGNGIYLNGSQFGGANPATAGNVIQGNFIGTNATGKAGLGNSQYGVNLNDAPQTQVGGTTPSARNIISANANGGVDLGFGDFSQVQGNYIGTDVTGTVALGSGSNNTLQGKGVIFTNGSNDLIGGTVAGAGNVLSGNSGNGIDCFVLGSSHETIQGNLVGTDATGTKPLGNGNDGIFIAGPTTVLIGGTVAGARNIVANNHNIGIDTFGSAINLTIQGNYVGTDITGTKAMGNAREGVKIWSPTNVLIGGTTAAARNIIANNGSDGIGTFASGQSMTIAGNYIGTDVTGTRAMGNAGAGINATFPNITIGGTAAGAGNVIANNGYKDAFDHAGIIVTSSPVTILSNSIYANDKLGIDLGGDGVTLNTPGGPHSGPNDLQNFPVLSRAANTGSASFIQGTLNSIPSTSFRLEFFANTTADSSSYGQGQTDLGATTVTTDTSGNASFTYWIASAVPTGQYISATATDPTGNTSEFAQDIVVGALTLRPPLAGNDTYAVAENATLTVSAPGVLANDSDPNGLPITATLVGGTGHGTLAFNANGSFTYTPTQNFDGTDSFTYEANDGQLDSNVATVSLTVVGPVQSLAVSGFPTTVTPGVAQNLTVTAHDAAGNVVTDYTGTVSFSSTDHDAVLPARYTFTAADAGTHMFSVTLETPGTQSITATDTGNATVTGSEPGITVQAITNATIWSSTAAPVTPAVEDSRSVELGVKFDSDVAGYITGIRFYKGSGNTGTHVGYLWGSTGTLLASATFTSETAGGWQQVNFSTPVAIAAGTTYIASYLAPNGHYAYDQGYFASSGVDNGVLHALSNTAAGGNGVFLYGTGGFPTGTWGATNYWVDIVFSTAVAPEVSSTTPAAGATGVSTTAPNITATFNEPVQGNTIAFVLEDSSGNTIPASVTYNTATATAVLTLSSALAAATTYTATVSGAQDMSSHVMASPFSWSFTTAAITNATIWSSTAAPVTPAVDDSRSVELGVKFASDVAGDVTGIRFYKGSGNAGTHVGYLWSSTGTLLASTTFADETAGGWQQVNFSTPVAIAAGTTYIASYLAPNGHYAYDQGYFADSGVDSGVLHALSNTTAGGNGVFLYGTGGFPTGTWGATNYWVDVVFSTSVTPSVAATTPAGGATGVSTTAPNITATFNEPVQGNTIVFVLTDSSGNTVPAAVTYDTATATATLTSSTSLAAATTYTATVSGAQDAAGDVMAGPFSWSFTTATAGITNATIWSSTAAPVTPAVDDSRSVELGVKFASDVAGDVTGIRFYKGSGNTGTHVGYLWSSTGTLLAAATFTNETATGWQQVNFSTPVAIAAGTTYIASYLAQNGHYAYDQGYFTSSGVDNGVLHALSNAAAGGNGVFLYGTGGFPTNTWGATNYWVDVVFSTTVTGGGASLAPQPVTHSLAALGSPGAASWGAVAVTGNGAGDNTVILIGTVDSGGDDGALDSRPGSKSKRL